MATLSRDKAGKKKMMSQIAQTFEPYQEWILLEVHPVLTDILPCILQEGRPDFNPWSPGESFMVQKMAKTSSIPVF